jgi:hypothetical protein
MKIDLKMGRWMHMPRSILKYQYYAILCGDYEAGLYNCLGMIEPENTKASFNVSINTLRRLA